MEKYIIKRLLLMIPVILGVTLLIFAIMTLTPGDPATIVLGADAMPEEIQELREQLGLNDPMLVRYFNYVKGIVTRFDFGKSYINELDVKYEILRRFLYTFRVALLSICISLCVGIPLGVIAAANRNSLNDSVAMTVALFGISIPGFWFGLMLSIVFSLMLGWLPSSGVGSVKHYIMPCIAVSLNGIASLARQTRSSMLEVIRADYITTARAKGQTEHKVIYKHALKNALVPVITQAGSTFGHLLGGAIVAETVFSIPGLGTYMVSAIKTRDYPAIQGAVIFLAVSFGLIMLLVDIVYAVIDPRIKAQYKKGV